MSLYTPIIGLEIHIELGTQSKMFCGCPADHFGKEPNSQTCPVCLGLPGAMPVPNKTAIFWTLRFGHALGCRLARTSKFDRKHYFYPDLPKGYQISQYDMPLCYEGSLLVNGKRIGVERVHLEEDTGKLKHTTVDGADVSLVDFNRSSVPLMEIVSEPDLRSGKEAYDYAKKIAMIARYVGVSDADMEKGSMRLEANISLATEDEISKGVLPSYKVEVKNINSFRYLKQAIDSEIDRHTELLLEGKQPKQETRGWNEKKNITFSQRSKESAKDYRYFPEPDIPPMLFDDELLKEILADLPLMPEAMYSIMQDEYGIRDDYVEILTSDHTKAALALAAFKLAQETQKDPTKVANYLVNAQIDFANLSAADLINQVYLPVQSEVDDAVYAGWISAVIETEVEVVAKYVAGKKNVLGALIGALMRESKGKADPKKAGKLLSIALEKISS